MVTPSPASPPSGMAATDIRWQQWLATTQQQTALNVKIAAAEKIKADYAQKILANPAYKLSNIDQIEIQVNLPAYYNDMSTINARINQLFSSFPAVRTDAQQAKDAQDLADAQGKAARDQKEFELKYATHTEDHALSVAATQAEIDSRRASAGASGASASAALANAQVSLAQLAQLQAQQEKNNNFQAWVTLMYPKWQSGEISEEDYRGGLQTFAQNAESGFNMLNATAQTQLQRDTLTQSAAQFSQKLGIDQAQAERVAAQWQASFDQSKDQFTQTGVWKQAEIDLGNRNATTQENQLALAQRNAEAQARQAQVQNVQSLSALQTRRQEAANQAMTSFEQYGVATPGRIASLNELRAPLPAGQAAAMLGMSAEDPEFQKVWGTYNKALTGTSPGEVAGTPQGIPEVTPSVPVSGGPAPSGPAPLPPISTTQYQGFSPFAAGLGMPGVQPPAPGITGGVGSAPPMVPSFTNGLMMQRGLVPV